MPEELGVLETVFRQLILAFWVYLDRQGRHLSLPFEFDAFVFFAWPITLPYYLFKSRGVRGLLLGVFFFVLLIVPSVAAVSIRLLR